MAAALVGGSCLSAFLQVLFDRMASREFVDFFRGRKINDRLLRKLKSSMRAASKVLNDAEEKQIADSAVRDWLDELKDAVYEADDLLDEIAYEALRSKLEAGTQSSLDQVKNSFSSFNPFESGVEEKLEKVVESLDDLMQQKDGLGLKEGFGEKPSYLSGKIPTTSLVDESGVYGRDDDKESVMKLLLSHDVNGKRLGVIPIVGMGGVGKTTLAQLVYNDSKVKDTFDLKVWVCVSEEFDVLKVTKDILKKVSSINFGTMTEDQLHCEKEEKVEGEIVKAMNDILKEVTLRNPDKMNFDNMTEDQLHCTLEQKLTEKKALLVLDDVWSDDQSKWDFLLTPFKSVQQGSKIIVTTRNENVASIRSTAPIHHLQKLSEDDCWFIFAKHAFDGESFGEHRELENIGKEISRKCKGLPLAAKTLGGILRSKRDAYEWEKILKSNIWDLPNDKILPALRLSYHYLPSHLKQCFAYCALFPKGYEFEKEKLVLLWMAEGFIVEPKGNKKMEEIGEGYFNDLVTRSFFQQSPNSSCYVMHDFINDLAKFVAGEFCFEMDGDHEDDYSCRPSEKTRHSSRDKDEFKDIWELYFEILNEVKSLRTFLLVNPSQWSRVEGIGDNRVRQFLQNFGCLRVLSLSSYIIGDYLSRAIGKLKHLRYLDLQRTRIRFLPDSVTGLYNLQTLILYGCHYLSYLPNDMMRLINLRYLDIRRTSLSWMPPQMGELINLHKLTDFISSAERGSSIKELGRLKHLWGELSIKNLENVTSTSDASEANLKEKKHLEKLDLGWNGDTNNSMHAKYVLEQLQPHTNVKHLSVSGYGGTSFPDWVGNSSFSNLVSLVLSGCKYSFSLPPLGQLASLKDLSIRSFYAVEVVGPEFYGSCTSMHKPFRSLERLRFRNMTQWQEWKSDEEGAFPLLQELHLHDCSKLSSSLPRHLPSLTTLEMEKCDCLVASFPISPTIKNMMLLDSSRLVQLNKSMPSGLHHLEVEGFLCLDSLLKELEKMGCFPTTLEEIYIRECDLLKCFPLELYPELKNLRIYACSNFESLCAYEGPLENFTSHIAPNLTELEFEDCSNLKSLPECMDSLLPSLVNLRLKSLPELESFPEGGLPCKLQSLHIERCNKLIASSKCWNLQRLSSLSHLGIFNCEELESFPEDTLLPSSLTSLHIGNLRNLKSLDGIGLQHLTSLETLDINFCPMLQSIPEEGLPGSLSSLIMFGCHSLIKRHRKVWPKISHIPNIASDIKLEAVSLQRTELARLATRHPFPLRARPRFHVYKGESSLRLGRSRRRQQNFLGESN